MKLKGEQVQAYDEIMSWLKNKDKWFFKLGGFAGSGKSYLIQYLINNYQGQLAVCCPTGKACSVLNSKIKNVYATTIHALIYSPIPPDNTALLEAQVALSKKPNSEKLKLILKQEQELFNAQELVFSYRDSNHLEPGQLIIVDESSMVPESVMKDLQRTGCYVLFVGDHGQIPPVKSKDWFGKLAFDSKLETIRRQALDSPIIRLSMDIRNGTMKASNYQGADCRVVGKPKVKTSHLVSTDQIICGMNMTRYQINRLIRSKMKYEGDMPLKGEKLICLKNEEVSGFYFINGVQCIAESDTTDDFGTLNIDMLYEGSHLKDVPFYGYHCASNYKDNILEIPWYERKELREFDFSYAITCHKAQGSEWDDVIVIDDRMNAGDSKFRKRWLYTACTRAAKTLTLVV